MNFVVRILPFQLIFESLPYIHGREATSRNLLAVAIKETLNSSKCFVKLGLDIFFLFESKRS
jgi:hypothetical protein